MNLHRTKRVRIVACCAIAAGTIAAAALAKNGSKPPELTPAERAIEYRKAVFTVIGGNFRPIGEMLQGRAPYDGAAASIRAQRLAQLSGLIHDSFPDISKSGDTRSKREIWTDRAEFGALANQFSQNSTALAAVLAKNNRDQAAFKAAATKVANDCKSCHDKFRTR